MKKLFYVGIIGLILFEIAKVYFIMPMPGSQRMNSIDLAYFLYTWRWPFRIFFTLLIIIGAAGVFKAKRKWIPALFLLLTIGISYAANYEMAADTMFYQPKTLSLKNVSENKVDKDRLIIGVTENGEAKAYPIQFIGYHHQIQDKLNGKPIIVTYCTVCRTGRVFEPLVDNKPELFRLVGMDHFNAMFEDETTHSWWRQANGEAITGSSKGKTLPEIHSTQTSLSEWIALHPNTLIMQPDPEFQEKYEGMTKYESGKGKSALTKTDSLSWKDKSWVVGIKNGEASKAFDWNRLRRERIINSMVGNQPTTLVLASDDKSFFAFARPSESEGVILKNDTLYLGSKSYNLLGKNISPEKNPDLQAINAYQEFWHSWQTFHPETEKY
ncbi:DUF3179 domain-containing (seleno)protein [Dyadobacter subterraneus]|uniref:DUF3179 domain-containing protein n=1 Tax=Dyadobacter subterraneus TaxID=2773304 RepID=A0ABR9W4I9_9BACT|nr:DUF3179 domain-containing (seleno)protein [Dyadobacter subterraneus]MBE9460380.1 DUF3179 domain-containing protein [Dyadobacter subterraneus]